MEEDLSNDMTWRQMIAVGVRRVVLARGELDKLEGPKYAARRTCDESGRRFSLPINETQIGCPQDPKSSFPSQKGTHEANLMLECSNRSEASSVGGPST